MKITILTLFPDMVAPYLNISMMDRAVRAGSVDFSVLNIREFSTERANAVDDTPYGGGAGMVMHVQPIHAAVEHARSLGGDDAHVVLLSAKGKRFTQPDAITYAHKSHMIFICGRYEGVDERVAIHIADEEVSIGEFVLTGGELGALTITDSIVRLLPGVLGNENSLTEESHSEKGYRAAPQYTKPASYGSWNVPDILLSGNHEKIALWRRENSG